MTPRIRNLAWALVLAGILWPVQGAAQAVSLLADRVEVSATGELVATGNVEVLFEGTRLTATSIHYDGATGRLTITGPLRLTDEAGKSVIIADAAGLDADLQNGLIQGARLILDQRMQLAAAEIARVDGRYTQLYRSVASSCRICAGSPVPVWQIRAERVIHDTEAQRLYFEKARLEIAGIPVFYLPRLSTPDPSATRATGFLVPEQRNSAQLGASIELPYFIVINDSRDLTVAPFLSAKSTTLKLRYRQAYRRGELEMNGAITDDDLIPDATRGYLFTEGRFDLPYDFELRFSLRQTSDRTYLATYDILNASRLENRVSIERTRAGDHAEAGLTVFRTLQGNEAAYADRLPSVSGRLEYDRRFALPGLGGAGLWSLTADAHRRDSNLDGAGRDAVRIGGRAVWGANRVIGQGIVARSAVELGVDAYSIADDSAYPEPFVHGAAAVLAELRWPLARAGGAHVGTLEPVVQLSWGEATGTAPPNEDSRVSSLDEGNLFSVSRYAGEDRVETGPALAAGVIMGRHNRRGWHGQLALGAVLYDRADPGFSASSGLSGAVSDLLVAGRLSFGAKFDAQSRALIADDGSVVQLDTRAGWTGEALTLAASHSWHIADNAQNRRNPVSEMAAEGNWRITPNWSASTSLRYDLDRSRPVKADLGVEYLTECTRVDLSLSRRFKSSANIIQDTDIGLQIELIGFGSGRAGPARACHQRR